MTKGGTHTMLMTTASSDGVPTTVSVEPRYAGFWIRWIAWLIDSTLLTLASWILELTLLGAVYGLMVVLGRDEGSAGFFDAFSPLFLQVFNAGIYACLAFPYYTWGHFKYGTTLGKRPFRIRVVNASDLRPLTLKQSIFRTLGYVVSYLPFACGYLMAALQPRKQALHDLLAGTVSVRERTPS